MMQSSGGNRDYQALLEAHLQVLGLPAFLQSYQAYVRDAVRNGLSPEQFLLGLFEAEMADRDARGPRRIAGERSSPSSRNEPSTISPPWKLFRKTPILELALGGYMGRAENLILVRNPGLGKTHRGIGLAKEGSLSLWATPTAIVIVCNRKELRRKYLDRRHAHALL